MMSLKKRRARRRGGAGTGCRREAEREGQSKERRKAKQVVHRDPIWGGSAPAPKKQALSRNFDGSADAYGEVTMYDSDDETYAMKKQREAAADAEAAYYRQKGKKRRKRRVTTTTTSSNVWCAVHSIPVVPCKMRFYAARPEPSGRSVKPVLTGGLRWPPAKATIRRQKGAFARRAQHSTTPPERQHAKLYSGTYRIEARDTARDFVRPATFSYALHR